MSPADGIMAGMHPVLPASAEADLAAAAALLAQGRLVGLPTETVYGLAAGTPRVLRPGAISAAQIADCLQRVVDLRDRLLRAAGQGSVPTD